MSLTGWVVLSVLAGVACGVGYAYSDFERLEDDIHARLFKGFVIATVVLAVYFSVDKNPVLTPLFYFLAVGGSLYRYVSSLLIHRKNEELREARYKEEKAQQHLKEEEERLKKEELAAVNRESLEKLAKKLRGD